MSDNENLFPKTPSMPQSIAGMFIQSIAREVAQWKLNAPEGKHLVVLLGTPDGGTMDVEYFQPCGGLAFSAIGYVNGELNKVVANIATLSFRGFYEDNKNRGHVGFKAFIEPPQESEPPTRGNK